MVENIIQLIHQTPDKIEHSPIVELNDQFSGHAFCALKRIEQISQQISRVYYSVILLSVGHVDFHVLTVPNAHVRCISSCLDVFASKHLPEKIQPIIQEMQNNVAALEVKQNFRGQNLGSLIWAIGQLFVTEQTSAPILITDSTDRTGRNDSFYVRWGANKTRDFTIAHQLSSEQISLLQSAGIQIQSSN